VSAVSDTGGPVRSERSPGDPGGRMLTLAGQHMLLLQQVTARASELQVTAANGQWPGAELASLAGYAQAEVLRQASDEEALLFPAAGPSPATARLARDHVRLRAAAGLLARAAAGEQALTPGQLAATVRDFVDQLEYHLAAEEKLLASGHSRASVPTTSPPGRPHG
jgi:hypothetical protein